jgi:hypothetical protein
MARKRLPLSPDEKRCLDVLLDEVIDPTVHHYGTDPRQAVRYDKREEMYGGPGTTYLLQMFEEDELVNDNFAEQRALLRSNLRPRANPDVNAAIGASLPAGHQAEKLNPE